MAELEKQQKLAEEEFAAATRWKVPSTCADSLILAGDVLVAGGSGELLALATASGERLATVKVEGSVKGLAVAAGRLLASTDSGVIHSFGAKGSPQRGAVAAKVVANPFSESDAGMSAKDINMDQVTAVMWWAFKKSSPKASAKSLAELLEAFNKAAKKSIKAGKFTAEQAEEITGAFEHAITGEVEAAEDLAA